MITIREAEIFLLIVPTILLSVCLILTRSKYHQNIEIIMPGLIISCIYFIFGIALYYDQYYPLRKLPIDYQELVFNIGIHSDVSEDREPVFYKHWLELHPNPTKLTPKQISVLSELLSNVDNKVFGEIMKDFPDIYKGNLYQEMH